MKPKHTVVFSKATSVYIVSMLTVFLFFCGSYGYQNISAAKLTCFRLLSVSYVIACAAILAEMLILEEFRPRDVKPLFQNTTFVQKAVAVYLVITCLAGLFSPYSGSAWLGASRGEGVFTICLYCLCFLLISSFGRVRAWMLPFFSLCVLIFDGICILQLQGGNPLSLFPEGLTYFDAYIKYPGAYLGTIGNVDLTAAFLTLAIPVFWVGLLRLSDRRRFLLLIPLAASLYVLVKMSVLAGFVGVFCGAAAALPVVLPVSPRAKKALGSVPILCAVLALGAVYFLHPESGLFYELHELLHGRAQDTFGSGRIHIWKNVWEHILRRPLLGYGPDTMILAQLTPFTRYDENYGMLIESVIDIAHNDYLNIWFHQGIFALGAYLAALLRCAWLWIKNSAEDSVCALLGSCVLCYCVQAFFGLGTYMVAPYFWIAFALLEGRVHPAADEQSKPIGRQTRKKASSHHNS